jgi:hypothetical protein
VGNNSAYILIVLEPFANEEVLEELVKVRVVRLVVEPECSGVVQENAKLIGDPTAEKIGGSRHLLFHDTVIPLLLCHSLQALPWECSAKEIHQGVSKDSKSSWQPCSTSKWVLTEV